MYDINSTREYRETVSMIYEEYKEEIETNARGVASAHIAHYAMFNHDVVVTESTEYAGEQGAIGTALSPYDVIRYSEKSIPVASTPSYNDTAHGRAVQCLARDLQEH